MQLIQMQIYSVIILRKLHFSEAAEQDLTAAEQLAIAKLQKQINRLKQASSGEMAQVSATSPNEMAQIPATSASEMAQVSAHRFSWELMIQMKGVIAQIWSKMLASTSRTLALNIALFCVTTAIFLYHSSLIVFNYQKHEVETVQVTMHNLSLYAPVVRIDHRWKGSPLLANITYKNNQNSDAVIYSDEPIPEWAIVERRQPSEFGSVCFKYPPTINLGLNSRNFNRYNKRRATLTGLCTFKTDINMVLLLTVTECLLK